MPLYRVEITFASYVTAPSLKEAERWGMNNEMGREGDGPPTLVSAEEATLPVVKADGWQGCIPYSHDQSPSKGTVDDLLST